MKFVQYIQAVLTVALSFSYAMAAELAPEVESLVNTAGVEDIPVIIRFRDKLDVSAIRDRVASTRRTRIVRELKVKSFRAQKRVRDRLNIRLSKKRLQNIRHLWMINAISAKLPADIIEELSRDPDIESITLDANVSPVTLDATTPVIAEWNLITIAAKTLWDLGFKGQGVVIGSMDTGVDVLHQDLADRWRGGSNSWFDPYGEHGNPYDANGHGTQTMGIAVGGNAGGSAIGVAPDAQWIAAKIFSDAGSGTVGAIHQAFQWMLDPDNNPDTDDAPHVVNNSWNLQGTTNSCNTEFQDDIDVLRNADIAVVFSAGNTGPNPSSSVSPANNSGSFETGAVDESLNVVYSSGRGASACDGGIYPQVAAPGFNIRTADLTFGGIIPDLYTFVSGTSFAAAHVTGAMALLKSAVAHATVDDIELAMTQSAVDVGASGADNDHGWGVINVADAYQLLQYPVNDPPVANDDVATAVRAWPVTINLVGNDTDINGAIVPASVMIVTPPSRGNIVNNADGTVTYAAIRRYPGSDTFTYQVFDNDGAVSNVATVTVNILRR